MWYRIIKVFLEFDIGYFKTSTTFCLLVSFVPALLYVSHITVQNAPAREQPEAVRHGRSKRLLHREGAQPDGGLGLGHARWLL